MGIEPGRSATERKYTCDQPGCREYKYTAMPITTAIKELALEGWFINNQTGASVEFKCPKHGPSTPIDQL